MTTTVMTTNDPFAAARQSGREPFKAADLGLSVRDVAEDSPV